MDERVGEGGGIILLSSHDYGVVLVYLPFHLRSLKYSTYKLGEASDLSTTSSCSRIAADGSRRLIIQTHIDGLGCRG